LIELSGLLLLAEQYAPVRQIAHRVAEAWSFNSLHPMFVEGFHSQVVLVEE
jgi:hypothetical protein